jgi:hypothetical protein
MLESEVTRKALRGQHCCPQAAAIRAVDYDDGSV